MDTQKISQFIVAQRKRKGLTQKQLADKLFISEKTVSKWECGKGLPEVSLMLPLCETLEITVNDLLSGERLSETAYREKAEENMLRLVEEENRENKKKLSLFITCALLTVVSVTSLVMLASFLDVSTPIRIILIAFALLTAIKGLAAASILELDAGEYLCPKCNHYFVPTMKAYINGPHTLTKRRLKCPSCGQKSYCKHVIVKPIDETQGQENIQNPLDNKQNI